MLRDKKKLYIRIFRCQNRLPRTSMDEIIALIYHHYPNHYFVWIILFSSKANTIWPFKFVIRVVVVVPCMLEPSFAKIFRKKLSNMTIYIKQVGQFFAQILCFLRLFFALFRRFLTFIARNVNF